MQRNREKKRLESVNALYQGRELVLNDFQREIFLLKQTQGTGIKILTPKQMSQVLQIALTQVKTDSTSERLLHEIGQVISLREKCPFSEFFWSAFSRIRTGCRKMRTRITIFLSSVYSLYGAKSTKNIYDNILNSIVV